DGSVSGIYHASLRLAERTAGNASKSSALPGGMRKLADSVNDLIDGGSEKGNDTNKNQNSSNQNGAQSSQSKPKGGSEQTDRGERVWQISVCGSHFATTKGYKLQ